MKNNGILLAAFVILLISFVITSFRENEITGFQSLDSPQDNPSTLSKLQLFLFGSGNSNKKINLQAMPISNGETIESSSLDIYLYYPQDGSVYNSKILSLNVSSPKQIIEWRYNLNKQGSTVFTPNTTITASVGLNKLIIYAKDNSSNTTQLSMQFGVDTRPPEIISQEKSPLIVYTNDNVVLSAVIADKGSTTTGAGQGILIPKGKQPNITVQLSYSLQSVWISGNWDGFWKNFTVKNTSSGAYEFLIPQDSLSNQETIEWFFNANDTAGNTISGDNQIFSVENLLPNQPILLEPIDLIVLDDNEVYFNWTDSIDPDNDIVAYRLIVATDPFFSGVVIDKQNLSQSEYRLTPSEKLPDDVYHWYVVAHDGYGEVSSEVEKFGVLTEKAISISLSDGFSSGILWNVTVLPAVNLGAEGNNGSGATEYDAQIYASGVGVDVYIRAEGDLKTSGNEVIKMENEKFSYNLTNNLVPAAAKFSLTNRYIDNKIGANITNGTIFYFKFYLNASANQPPGSYSNNISITAVPFGTSPF